MSIVLQGSTSGSITLQEPAIAGSTVLSLPATTGTVLTSASPSSDLPSSINGPAFAAWASATQSLSAATTAKITFDTEDFDTNNNFASSRFTPTVAGYYQVTARVRPNATNGEAETTIYKNGNSWLNGSNISVTSGNQNGSIVTGLIYMNGSTDYIETYIYVTNACTTSAGRQSTFFQGVLVRAA